MPIYINNKSKDELKFEVVDKIFGW